VKKIVLEDCVIFRAIISTSQPSAPGWYIQGGVYLHCQQVPGALVAVDLKILRLRKIHHNAHTLGMTQPQQLPSNSPATLQPLSSDYPFKTFSWLDSIIIYLSLLNSKVQHYYSPLVPFDSLILQLRSISC